MSELAAVGAAEVAVIAEEIFAGLVDGQSGHLTVWHGSRAPLDDPLYAWVDLSTQPESRLLLATEAAVAEDLARALLRVEAAEPVTEADVVDAYGELANVFGGNIKALLPAHVGITLPGVSHESATGAGARLLHEVVLTWRGRPFTISWWTL